MIYIATFYSHFGAIRFKKNCESQGIKAKVMPVPRDLSSSCGTCVRYEGSEEFMPNITTEEIEQIVRVQTSGYSCVFRAENS